MKFNSLSKALNSIRTVRKTESQKLGAADSISDSIVHDASILKSITKLSADFRVPEIFRDWALSRAEQGQEEEEEQEEGEREGENIGQIVSDSTPHHRQRSRAGMENSWHTLSIGASKTGLPFHSQGNSYVAVVHGNKRWFVYPPGARAPVEVAQETHPLRSVWGWFTSAYSLYAENDALLSIPKAPFPKKILSDDGSVSFAKSVPQSKKHKGYKPMECMQSNGDIVFIPQGWLQSHLNIGETVSIGHQQVSAC
jgi:hypothetical protein